MCLDSVLLYMLAAAISKKFQPASLVPLLPSQAVAVVQLDPTPSPAVTSRIVRLGGPSDWAQSAHRFSACEHDRGVCHVLNATALVVTFLLPLLSGQRLHARHVSCIGRPADVRSGKATASHIVFRLQRRATSHSQLLCIFKEPQPNRAGEAQLGQGELLQGFSRRFEILEKRGACSHCENIVWNGGNAERTPVFAFFTKPSVVVRCLFRNASLVGYPRFFVSQACVFVVLRVCPGTCVVPSRSVSSVLDTLTPVFELYVRLRERRQWDSDFLELGAPARDPRGARHGPAAVSLQ
ncbi:hypothetical protein Taro_030456, partial [Colocasia esculenta]|nr:hypothetical protein [Colocasia esculenta]